MKKPLLYAFVGLLLVLQYQVWFGEGGIAMAWNTHKAIKSIRTKNANLLERNAILQADVHDLKHGRQAIEERARSELGMVKRGEVFYQLVTTTDE